MSYQGRYNSGSQAPKRGAAAALETVVDGGGDEKGSLLDERTAAAKTKGSARRRRRNCSDPGRLCVYIGADPLAPVRGWNRC